jgi:hypothetical protein
MAHHTTFFVVQKWPMIVIMTVLMTVHGTDGPPSLADSAKQLGLSVDDLDPGFGVLPIDPTRGLYSVQVRADRVPPETETAQPYHGPFSNPKIAPFGPIQSGPDSVSGSSSPEVKKPPSR